MPRERDIRSAVKDAIIRTGQVPAESVYLANADEVASKDSDPLVVTIDPHATTLMASGPMSTSVSAKAAVGWDAPGDTTLVPYQTQVTITVIARDQDPETRDNLAELTLAYIQDAIDGQVLVDGFTAPMDTIIGNWTWSKPVPPERRVAAIARVAYLVPGWDGFDTSP